jgi:DNA-binding LacI/PurR family transcriptional regulator
MPGEVQLIGFDKMSYNAFLPWRFSTMAQDTEGMGMAAGNIVLSMIQKDCYEPLTVVPVTFWEGDTTKKAPYHDAIYKAT